MPIDIFRVGFVLARALTARYPTVSTPQTKGWTMATASKLGAETREPAEHEEGTGATKREPRSVCRLEGFFSCRDERAS